jgi:Fe-S-cluster-containing dehydrogenase component
MEACPTGARVFGNLLDPASEIRYILANKAVFRLKEELGAEPKFWYYRD